MNGPVGELGELTIVAGRQVRANLVDLLFHEMIIVDEPFRGGRYGAPVIDRLYGGTICAEQHGPVVGETPRQRLPLDRSRRHDLRDRKAARMVLEPLNAEQFFANRVLAVPKKRRTRGLQGAARENFHLTFLPRDRAPKSERTSVKLRAIGPARLSGRFFRRSQTGKEATSGRPLTPDQPSPRNVSS